MTAPPDDHFDDDRRSRHAGRNRQRAGYARSVVTVNGRRRGSHRATRISRRRRPGAARCR